MLDDGEWGVKSCPKLSDAIDGQPRIGYLYEIDTL